MPAHISQKVFRLIYICMNPDIGVINATSMNRGSDISLAILRREHQLLDRATEVIR